MFSRGSSKEGDPASRQYYTEICKQVNELNKQIEVTQPLINLLDNMVTMGSLFGGDNALYASQYKPVCFGSLLSD